MPSVNTDLYSVSVRFRQRAVAQSDALQDDAPSDARSDFWSQALSWRITGQESLDQPLPTDAVIQAQEREFATSFPTVLHRRLVNHFASNDVVYLDQRSNIGLLPLVIFEVKSIGYGSLEFVIGVIGLENLLRLFDNNIDLISGFMAANVAPAAADVLLTPAGLLDVRVNELPGVRAVASEFGRSIEPSAVSSQRHGLVWALVNTSLLVPVALGFFVLWLAFDQIRDERSSIEQRTQFLDARESEFIESLIARIEDLEQEKQ